MAFDLYINKLSYKKFGLVAYFKNFPFVIFLKNAQKLKNPIKFEFLNNFKNS